MRFKTDSAEATAALASALSEALSPGDVIALDGDLGAGKTVFVRGLARALGVPDDVPVRSPSYTLVHHYEDASPPLAHLDLYRLGDEDELEAIGFRDLLDGRWVVAVEWPSRAPHALSQADWWVTIAHPPVGAAGMDARTVTVVARDPARAWSGPEAADLSAPPALRRDAEGAR